MRSRLRASADSTGEKPVKDPPPKQVSYFELYKFSTPAEKLLIALGVVMACASGVMQPLSIVIFGDIIDAFSPTADLMSAIRTSAIQMTVLGCISFVCATLQVLLLVYTGNRQATRIRYLYFRAIVRQEMAWYDSGATGELTTRISGYVRHARRRAPREGRGLGLTTTAPAPAWLPPPARRARGTATSRHAETST